MSFVKAEMAAMRVQTREFAGLVAGVWLGMGVLTLTGRLTSGAGLLWDAYAPAWLFGLGYLCMAFVVLPRLFAAPVKGNPPGLAGSDSWGR
ncbi:MAG: hypothetical protein R3F17_03155 [Planctomycetota bacterium]